MGEYTIVQLVKIDETGDSYYRMRWPGRVLAAQTGWRVISLDSAAEERFSWGKAADLLVLFQSSDMALLPLIEERRAAGKKTLVEYNDNFYAAPPSSPASHAWNSPLLHQIYETFMRKADGVLVTCAALADLFADKAASPIYTLTNHLPDVPPPFAGQRKRQMEDIRIGWAGSIGHMADFLAALPTIRRLLQESKEARLYIMGNEALPKLLQLPQHRFSFHPWGTMREYYDFLKEVDIGLAPLLDTPYNRCRSDIKAVEMSAFGAAPVLPDRPPYHDFLKAAGIPGFQGLDGMEAMVLQLASDPAQIDLLAKRAHEYTAAHRVALWRTERKELYERLLPSTPTDFNWPVPAGYHELSGCNKNSTPPHLKQIQEAGNLEAAGRKLQAAATLDNALTLNPDNADLAVARLRAARDWLPEQRTAFIGDILQHFPNDLRFKLLAAENATGRELTTIWSETIAFLRQRDSNYRSFFARSVIIAFNRDQKRNSELLQLTEQLLSIYPQSMVLQLVMAEAREREGDYTAALLHFERYLEISTTVLINRDEAAISQPGYAATWIAALKAR